MFSCRFSIESAAGKKLNKYAGIMNSYTFVPLAFETLGPINTAATEFIDEIGRRSHAITGDQREKVFHGTATLQRSVLPRYF